ncbi:MAG: VWA domain-containing protein [Myxococcales bacterium]|nr:VWA domain-containing protein [Myxococcales bacterium]
MRRRCASVGTCSGWVAAVAPLFGVLACASEAGPISRMSRSAEQADGGADRFDKSPTREADGGADGADKSPAREADGGADSADESLAGEEDSDAAAGAPGRGDARVPDHADDEHVGGHESDQFGAEHAGMDGGLATVDAALPRSDDDDAGSAELPEGVRNLLLVFDRSSSMATDWEGKERWRAAGEAVVAALSPADQDVNVGAVFFPTPLPAEEVERCHQNPLDQSCSMGCGVERDSSFHIEFVSGNAFVARFTEPGVGVPAGFRLGDQIILAADAAAHEVTGSEPPYFPIPASFTPLLAGLQRADELLTEMTGEQSTAVMVITDGHPNCDWDPDAAKALLRAWQMRNIPTHVVGLPGPLFPASGPPGAQDMSAELLGDLAAAGGTGDFTTPDNPDILREHLRAILRGASAVGGNPHTTP